MGVRGEVCPLPSFQQKGTEGGNSPPIPARKQTVSMPEQLTIFDHDTQGYGTHNATREPPARTVTIIADGGFQPNLGGRAYGSFLVEGERSPHRIDFGTGPEHSNNTAEIETLCEVLAYLTRTHSETERRRTAYRILTDSTNVVNWVTKARRPRTGNVKRINALLDRYYELRRGFARVEVEWHDRSNSVAALGH